jgi:flagellar assembly protein FliH
LSNGALQRWEYRETDLAPAPLPTVDSAIVPTAPPGMTEEQVLLRVASALAEAEQRWNLAAEQQEAHRREQVEATLQAFSAERDRYYREAETEVVQLALAIARKIVDREALIDPALLQALVRIGLERIEAGSAVTIRIATEDTDKWKHSSLLADTPHQIALLVDPALSPGDCTVETDLGTAEFGLDAQFKRIEESMSDLLRLRPGPEAATGRRDAKLPHSSLGAA